MPISNGLISPSADWPLNAVLHRHLAGVQPWELRSWKPATLVVQALQRLLDCFQGGRHTAVIELIAAVLLVGLDNTLLHGIRRCETML